MKLSSNYIYFHDEHEIRSVKSTATNNISVFGG